MNCKEIQELMWCGEITPDVRTHLESCARCRAEHTTLQELGIAVETVEIPRPTRSLLPSRAEIEAVITMQKRRRVTKWLSAGAVAACLALAVTQVPGLWDDKASTPPSGVDNVIPHPQPNGVNVPTDQTVDQQIRAYLTQYGHPPQSDQLQDWTRMDTFILAASTDEGQSLDRLSRYYEYVNVFSQQVHLDLSPYRVRSDISAYLVPLRDMQNAQGVFVIAGGTQVIGAWIQQVSTAELTSLDNKHFGEITNMPWAQWVQEQKWETITPEMEVRTPEELLVQYADAKSREDYAAIAGMLTAWSYISQSVEVADRSPYFSSNDAISLPVQRGLKTSDVKVKEMTIPGPEPSEVSKRHNRIPVESKVYQVTVPGGTRFVTVVRETKGSPWQIDRISTGP